MATAYPLDSRDYGSDLTKQRLGVHNAIPCERSQR